MSHGSTWSNPPNVDDPTLSLFDKVESLKEGVTNILETTTWPGKSAGVAQEFLRAIKNTPNLRNISDPAAPSSPDLINDVEGVIKVLEDVRGKLAGASMKYGVGKEGVSASIKEVISWGAASATKILRSCREEVNNVWTPLHRRLEIGFGVARPSMTGRGPHGTAKEDDAGPSLKMLNAAGKIFTAVETVSGLIPIVGSFVGAAAKVGAAVVNMVQKMEENEQITKDLEKRVSKLSDLIGYFKEQSVRTGGGDVIARINELEIEITDIQKQVEEWNSGKLKKAWPATDHSDALKVYQKTVEDSLAEMKVLADFDFTELLQQIYTNHLLNRLGKEYYGVQSTSSDNATCLPGTRVAILDSIDDWVNDWKKPESAKRVLWIRGRPGSGKSTIARTVADRWKDRAACATFHVRRGQGATSKQAVRDIARQLAQSSLPEVASAVLGSVKANKDIAQEIFEDQFEKLLISPLQSLKYPPRPIILIIDALDEFEETKEPLEIIRLIHDHASKLPANIKFLLTSRSREKLISDSRRFLEHWQTVDLDSLADAATEADINRFVENEFLIIKQKRGKEYQLGENWPSSADIGEVVRMSQGIFQWARTAMAYIDAPSPDSQLRSLLRSRLIGGRLSDLYDGILSTAFNSPNVDSEHRELLSRVLGTLVVSPRPVTLDIVAFLYSDHVKFIGLQQNQHVHLLRDKILRDVNSLIHIPKSPSEPMRLRHTSIRDFLMDKENSPYGVDVIQENRRLLDACLHLMERDLRRNICDLSSILKPTFDNDEIRKIVDLKVSQGLRHCCRVWSMHLTAGRPWKEVDATTTINLPSELKPFSERNILKWLEIMSLIGAMDEAWGVAKNVGHWLLDCPVEILDSSLIALWDDTQRFIAVFHEPISYGILHIYSSAVAQCPVNTKIWEHYGSFATVHVPKNLQMRGWSPCVWSKSMDSRVCSITISPDGKTLASGYGDGMIRLWNAQTGSSVGKPLQGHSDWVNSVAFSPDSKTLASGSHDFTIQLWNVQTGSPLSKPLQGHSDSVRSVAFSPDGKTLASGSGDGTIRLWNVQTELTAGKALEGHSGSVRSVAFSLDGETLASGSYDNTIRLWNWNTGSPLGEPLRGHSGSVMSIAFLPDGMTLVSGSEDKTIRLWNSQTGVLLGNPLEGHSEAVLSVTCSLDGNTLASGSHDCAIRLWNAQDGSPVGEPLKGHSGPVTSVAFSPDSKTLASGSHDFAIRLWNAQTGPSLAEPQQGHSDSVTSFAFSPDGKTLASGSNDRTIRLWNADTGSLLGEPLQGHSDSVTSVAFSLDGETLASGSDDRTVRLWKVQTRSQLGKPLQGHSGSVKSVAFSVDGRMLASGSDDETIRLWNVQTGSLFTEPLEGHSGWVRSVAFSPDGKTLVSGSGDGTIRLWNVQTGLTLGKPLEGHSNAVLSVAFSPDGKTVASGSDDRTIRLWDVQTKSGSGKPLKGHSDWVRSVAFSPDGRLRTSIHRQTHMHGTSQPGIELSHQGQWLTLGNDRLLWLPENYWRGFDGIAFLFRGTVAFVSGGFVFCFNVSDALQLLVD